MRERGFHFIEVLIVLIIIGLLTAVSLPIYTQYLRNTHRLEAVTTLAKLALALEHYFIAHQTYQGATLQNLQFSEYIAHHAYQLMMRLEDNHYLLKAQPTAQHIDPLCQTLILDANGEKKITGTGSVEQCW